MAREIKSYQDANVLPSEANSYKDRLLKLIPSEIIAAYITLHGLVIGLGNKHEKTNLINGNFSISET